MKNIHVLPTDKPSRLTIRHKTKELMYSYKYFVNQQSGGVTLNTNQNIYITSDEEIKEGVDQWYLDKVLNKPRNSSGSQYGEKQDVIILTTDKDLIKDGVQAIDDEFLEWFVKNPSCESVEVTYDKDVFPYGVETAKGCGWYKIIIPKEEPKQYEKNPEFYGTGIFNKVVEPKQETLEEAAEIDLTNLCYYDKRNPDCSLDDEDIEGHKKSLLKKNKTCSCDNCFYGRTELTEQLILQAERMYSEEDMYKFANFCRLYDEDCLLKNTIDVKNTLELFEQFKKK